MRRSRVESRSAARRRSIPEQRSVSSSSIHGSCRYCKARVLWLAHQRTGRVQPVNELPEDGGNLRVVLDAGGRPTGLYVVVPKVDWARHQGELHTAHVTTCSNATARRLMRERQADRHDLDADAPPAVLVPCGAPGCPYPLPDVDLAAGEAFHATCDPRYRDRRRQ
jgi:hypothetical protein